MSSRKSTSDSTRLGNAPENIVRKDVGRKDVRKDAFEDAGKIKDRDLSPPLETVRDGPEEANRFHLSASLAVSSAPAGWGWRPLAVSVVVLLTGLGMNGHFLLLWVGLVKQFGWTFDPSAADAGQGNRTLFIFDSPPEIILRLWNSSRHLLTSSSWDYHSANGLLTNSPLFSDLPYYILSSLFFGYVTYFPLCGFLQWYFYICRKEQADDWKCQPRKFLSWKDEKHEILFGTLMLSMASFSSGIMSCYLMNGGYSTMYYLVSDYGWVYYFASIPGIYIVTDFGLYFAHRAMHLPWMYRRVHKWHHRYKQPTAFSATAMHPVEFYTYQLVTFLPIFVVPIHWSVFLFNILYMFYYGMVDHSGIKMDAFWPWQPSSTFHDNHHQYFHVNFGFNSNYWDRLFGTMRVKRKIYNENIFYGVGKEMTAASQQELNEHFENIKDD